MIFFFALCKGNFTNPRIEQMPLLFALLGFCTVMATPPERFVPYDSVAPLNIDSLPNLVIVTFDKSGSMLWSSTTRKSYNHRNVRLVHGFVHQAIKSGRLDSAFSFVDFDKDNFLFYETGILEGRFNKAVSLAHIEHLPPFRHSFIHSFGTSEVPETLSREELHRELRNLALTQNYRFQYSFVSLIRLFAIQRAFQEVLIPNGLSSQYGRIFIVSITDDLDQNDEWMLDYRSVKKFAPEKEMEVRETMSRYVHNPFDAASEVQYPGQFQELYEYEGERIKLFAHEYISGSADVHKPFSDSSGCWFSIKIDSNYMSLELNEIVVHGDSIITFVPQWLVFNETDTMKVGPMLIVPNTPVRLELPNGLPDTVELRLSGYFQVAYNDMALGPRIRKAPFEQVGEVVSADAIYAHAERIIADAHRMEQKRILIAGVIGAALLIALSLLVFWLLIRPRTICLRIYHSLELRTTVTRSAITNLKRKHIWDIELMRFSDTNGNTPIVNQNSGFASKKSKESCPIGHLVLFSRYRLDSEFSRLIHYPPKQPIEPQVFEVDSEGLAALDVLRKRHWRLHMYVIETPRILKDGIRFSIPQEFKDVAFRACKIEEQQGEGDRAVKRLFQHLLGKGKAVEDVVLLEESNSRLHMKVVRFDPDCNLQEARLWFCTSVTVKGLNVQDFIRCVFNDLGLSKGRISVYWSNNQPSNLSIGSSFPLLSTDTVASPLCIVRYFGYPEFIYLANADRKSPRNIVLSRPSPIYEDSVSRVAVKRNLTPRYRIPLISSGRIRGKYQLYSIPSMTWLRQIGFEHLDAMCISGTTEQFEIKHPDEDLLLTVSRSGKNHRKFEIKLNQLSTEHELLHSS